jgi:hypothetical protein
LYSDDVLMCHRRIKLSGASGADPELLPLIRGALADSAIGPARPVFEISETTTLAHVTEAIKFATAVGSLGCRLAPLESPEGRWISSGPPLAAHDGQPLISISVAGTARSGSIRREW